MTVFVERRNGVVVGVYANKQNGYAEESMAANDPEVLAVTSRPVVPQSVSLTTDDVLTLLVAKGVVSAKDVDDAKGSKGGR